MKVSVIKYNLLTQACLLTGNNRDAIRFAEQLDVVERVLSRTPALVHRGKCVADLVSMSRVCGQHFGDALRELVMIANG